MLHPVLPNLSLTGVKMGKAKSLAEHLTAGTTLAIIPRPDNSFDSQAMSVHFGLGVTDPQVGWIPAKEFEDRVIKSVLFNHCMAGLSYIGKVENYDPAAGSLVITVCLVAPEFEDEDDGPDDDDDDDDDDSEE